MAMIKKSITVTDQQAQWIQSQISICDFDSDSEVLRDLIRKEQARNTEVETIRAALIKAEGMGTTD
jgi:antitoxin ParD1/3/4